MKIHTTSKSSVITAGIILLALIIVPITHALADRAWLGARTNADNGVEKLTVSATAVRLAHESGQVELASDFFGQEANERETKAIIERQMAFVSSREAYQASLSVIRKHENKIRIEAERQDVPEDVALGVALLENGGSETAISRAGALGVFQLMPGTARNLGLTVNKRIDERRNPKKNIEGGVSYLRANYERFGDWGLSTWAYHAGEGNVTKALKIYAKANHGISLPGLKEAHVLRNYVGKYGITIHKLLSDPSVRAFTKKLSDDSSGYPYKVVATATLFRKASGEISVLPGDVTGTP